MEDIFFWLGIAYITVMAMILLAAAVLGLITLINYVGRRVPWMAAGVPSMPGGLATYWTTNWVMFVVLPLLVLCVLVLAPLIAPQKYNMYLAWGGPLWLLIPFPILVAVALTISNKWVRGAAVGVLLFLFGIPVLWALAPAMLGKEPTCDARTDSAEVCQHKEAAAAGAAATEKWREQQRKDQAQQAALKPQTDPLCNRRTVPITLGDKWIDLHGDRCTAQLLYEKQEVELYVKTAHNSAPQGPYRWGERFPYASVAVMNKGRPIEVLLQISPSPNETTSPTSRFGIYAGVEKR